MKFDRIRGGSLPWTNFVVKVWRNYCDGLALSLVVIFVLWDAATRLALPPSDGVNDRHGIQPVTAAVKGLTVEDGEAIIAALKPYDASVAESGEGEGQGQASAPIGVAYPDDAQQALQQGDLPFLYIGQEKYRLRGIFSLAATVFAVLEVEDMSTQAITSLKVIPGESLSDYQIEKISPQGVEFVAQDGRKVNLKLFMRAPVEGANQTKK